MTATEIQQQIRSKLAFHKARAYDIKNQLEFEENQIIALTGALDVVIPLAATEAEQPEGAQDARA